MLEQDLKRIGLTQKEASVYLACLQLGPAPVQQISRKAKVVRATTYVVLESLMEKGLVTHYKEGKKTLFAAEPPRQLERLLEKQQEEVNEKRDELDELLPQLQVLMKSAGERPSVRYFEGREGLHAMRQEIIMYSHTQDIIYNFTPADDLTAVFPDEESTFSKQRVAKGIKGRTIFTTRSTSLKKRWLAQNGNSFTQRRFILPEKFPFSSGMTIYRDRVAIGSFKGKQMGVILESSAIAEMLQKVFELAWDGVSLQED